MNIKRILPFVTLAALSVSTLISCGRRGAGEDVDNTKTQLYIKNYNSGYGDEWLADLAARFEEANKDVEWTPGKKGVQCILHQDKENINTSDDILTNREDDIFFRENIRYYMFAGNGDRAMMDLSDIITGENPYEPGKTIESKMTAEQQKALNVNGKYYAIPNYSGCYGIIYNVSLFKSKNLYFAKNPTATNKFIASPTQPKSAGPDGVEGTYDDGLPVTLDDYIELCEQIVKKSAVPLMVTGKHADQYFNTPLFSYMATNDGYEASSARFSFESSSPVSVMKMNNGKVDSSHTTEQVSITKNNPVDIMRTEGVYNAIDWMNKIMNPKYIANPNEYTFNTAVTQIMAQDYFINGFGGQKAAMLFDGMWWFNEARNTLRKIPAEEQEEYGWMPMPRQAGNTENVYFDQNSSYGFIKRNMPKEKVDLAKNFLQFTYTDESMKKFTKNTNALIGLNYEMNEDEISELSSFGQNLMRYKNSEHTHLLYSLDDNDIYKKYEADFRAYHNYFYAENESNTMVYPSRYFYNNGDYGKTTDEYFNLLFKRWSKTLSAN